MRQGIAGQAEQAMRAPLQDFCTVFGHLLLCDDICTENDHSSSEETF